MSLEPYKAIICGKEKLVRGWGKKGKILFLGEGERWTFEPLKLPDSVKSSGFSYKDRTLITVCTLRFQDGDWLIDGKILNTWLETEMQRTQDERNQRRAARGLPPVGFFTTHPDLTLDAWRKGEPAPDTTADERRLDADPNCLRWLFLYGKLKGDEFGLESKRLTGAVSAVAWFEGHEDEPLLLRSFCLIAAPDTTAQPEKEPKEVAGNRKREGLPETQFRSVKLRNGKHIELPEGAREVVVSLDALGRRDIPCVALKEEIARMRGVKELPESYSPAKVLKGSLAGCKLIKDRIVTFHRKDHQKLTLYTIRLLKGK